ncbi:uncharacterized protein LOC143859415 [Tasmannia lanceolata]|uniref:uncharacterized protein LOC143859415 n=1 Tax=Tasmannia lanceolata TaxID=3420 RepID=UPI004062C05C
MEVYVDDMLVKSLKAPDHIADLEEAFTILRRNRMKLNPAKCAFGVTSGKFQDFQWTEECQAVFDQLKAYLQELPLLSKPVPGESLYLYLAVGSAAVSSVLVQQEGKAEQPIYYVSRVLHDAEIRYQEIEKFAFAVVISVRKLRPYFQAHPIIIQKPNTSGRLINWAVELSEFNIQIKPRPAIKSQSLADFIVERTLSTEELEEPSLLIEELTLNQQRQDPLWMLYVDGSSNAGGNGARLVITGPDNFIAEYALRIDFKASNNEAEYEALITGIALAAELQVSRIRVHSDSQLVVNQVNDFSEAKEERMIKYLEKVRREIFVFEEFQIVQVPRTLNARADALSKMASSGIFEQGNVYTEILPQPSVEREEVLQLNEEPS